MVGLASRVRRLGGAVHRIDVIVDVIDAHTNQLVWRGYDTGTLDTKNPDKTLTKAVDHVLSRFSHDAKEAQEHVG
jgi:hypothetical protein